MQDDFTDGVASGKGLQLGECVLGEEVKKGISR